MTMKEGQSKRLFWLDDLQWSMLEPQLPTNRLGRNARMTVRIISGIIHVQQAAAGRIVR